MSGAIVGQGVLRRDAGAPQAYRGEATIAGFPYTISATVEADAEGRYFALRFRVAPIPPHLRIAGLDDEASPA